MSAAYSLTRDLDELLQMTEKLRTYILGDALYMPIGGGFLRGGGRPQLTLGALLLRRRRLAGLRGELDAARQSDLDAALALHDELQQEWRLHYGKKLEREVQSRLKLMSAFFRDCAESPRDCASAYPVEALRRTIVQEILLALEEFDYEARTASGQVQHADGALRRYVLPGAFIWAAELQPVYRSDVFWWLYGRPEALV